MYTDILRSYSSAAIGPVSSNSSRLNAGDWPPRTAQREPLRLKLSILSDIDPGARSILNGNASGRSYPSVWHRDSDQDRPWSPVRRDSDKSGVTLAVVGIKRTASAWNQPPDYDDHFSASRISFDESPSAQRRGRVRSEPAGAFSRFPVSYTKTDNPISGSIFLNGTHDRSFRSNERDFARDRQRGIDLGSSAKSRYQIEDVDDALDEVFSSIVRRALNDDAASVVQTQTSSDDNSERLGKFSRAGTGAKSKHSRHLVVDDLTQPFFDAKRAVGEARRDAAYNRTNVENREKPFYQQLEKVNGGKKSTAQLLDDENDSSNAWSYQPFYYRSTAAPGAESCSPSHLLRQRGAIQGAEKEIAQSDLRSHENRENLVNSNRYLQKSDPFLNARRPSPDSISEKKPDSKQSSNEINERFAPGATSYYAEDIPTSGTFNRRRPFNESVGGKLRMAKSESSLRMANKELLLSDKEIYQIEIMNSGLSASRIYVCQCLANLYFDDGASSSESAKKNQSDSPWRRIATGVPVLVLETDQQPTSNPKSIKDPQRQSRKLLIRLAELGNGFKLWEDVIDAYSGYAVDRTFHTLTTSADYRRRAGLSFDSHSAALKFHQHVREFSEELDSFAADGGENSKRRNKSIWAAFRRMNTTDGSSANGHYGNGRNSDFTMPSNRRATNWSSTTLQGYDAGSVKKTDISMPCCFKHVTSLKAGDVLPSAMLVTSASTTACPSTITSVSACNTLTRVNRSATIKSTNSKSQSSTIVDDGIGITDIAFPKRAQSCTQILSDHSQRRDSSEDGGHLLIYRSTENSNGSSNSYLPSENSNYSSLVRRYTHSVEPVI